MIDVEIWFPDQISGPPVGWRSAKSRVAMLRAKTELHAGVCSLRLEGHFDGPLTELIGRALNRGARRDAEGAFVV